MPTPTSAGCARGSMSSSPDSFQQIYSFMRPSLSPVSTGRNPHRWPAVRQSAPLLAWLLLALCEPAFGAEQTLPISIADGPPFSIIRGDKLLEAAKGARIQAGDFIMTQSGNFVVANFASGTVVAFGPSTRVYLLPDGSTFIVLRGWVKLDAHGPGEGTLRRAIGLQLGAAARQGVFVLHAVEHRDEIFQEFGVMTLLLRDDTGVRTNRESKTEQYFTREEGMLTVAPRPAAAFVADMPVPFRDPLPDASASGLKAKVAEPKVIHDVAYADVADWLTIPKEWRAGFIRRFRGRLRDSAFFSAMDARLSLYPEWTLILHPPPPPDETDAQPPGRNSTSPKPH
jgi:hypothetical protein